MRQGSSGFPVFMLPFEQAVQQEGGPKGGKWNQENSVPLKWQWDQQRQGEKTCEAGQQQ